MPAEGTEMAAVLPIPIQTPRLVLRRLAGQDARDLFELMADEASFRYLDWMPLDETQVEEWLDRDKTAKLTNPDEGICFGVERTDQAKLIGFLSLYYREKQPCQELKLILMIHPSHRRQGFGKEAVQGAMQFVFAGLQAHRMVAYGDSRNTAVCRLLEAAGMRREGESIKANWVKGEWVNQIWYAMLDEEYRPAN